MYDVDSLIDRIRQLEDSESLVHTVTIYGSNSCGDPFGWIQGVYRELSDIPPCESLFDEVFKCDYEGYVESSGECCNHNKDCCGSPVSFEDWKRDNIKVLGPSQYAVDAMEKAIEAGPKAGFHLYFGSMRNDWDESMAEMVIQTVKVR